VVAVFRHADRTPKQKMKMKMTDYPILKYFEQKGNKQVKLKTAKELEVRLHCHYGRNCLRFLANWYRKFCTSSTRRMIKKNLQNSFN